MSRLRWRPLIGAILVGMALWFSWGWLFPSPERLIRKRLAELAQAASFAPNEGPLAKAWNAQKMGDFFTPDVVINVDAPGYAPQTLAGREAVVQAAAGARSTLTGLSVEFPDIVVALGPDKQSATVDLTAKASVHGERDRYVQELKVLFKKTDGHWLIRRVEPVKTLS
ncbi:conserved exported hypothetical protein [Verrucomicrobia bacterium]|nr:conserved exported hypothetical protein [Verrucomicrobiota bacterium]